MESLRDGRAVFIDGRRVDDVTTDPAFQRGRLDRRALRFPERARAAEQMTYAVDGGSRANRIWQLPESYGELVERRQALEAWAELHGGFIGRGPDHVASCISGIFMGLDVFEGYDPKRAAAVATTTATPATTTCTSATPSSTRKPTVRRARAEQSGEFLTAGVVDRDAAGITIRGAKMLATGAPLANEIFVTCIQALSRATRNTRSRSSCRWPAGPQDSVAQILRGRRPVGVRQPARRAVSMKTMRSSISTTCRCRGNACSSTATSTCACGSFMPRRRTSTRTIKR